LSSGALAAGLPLLPACGGGDGAADPADGGDPGSGGGGGGALSDAQRAAVIAAVEQRADALWAAPGDAASRAQAAADFLATLPAYVSTGLDTETATAWGHFTDGRLHLVSFNYAPQRRAQPTAAPAGGTRRALAAAPELPRAEFARVMQAFGPPFDGQDVVDDLGQWLQVGGYSLRPTAVGDARVSSLRQVQGDGFLYLNSHGGAGGNVLYDGSQTSLYSLQSSTLVDPLLEQMPDFREDLAQLRLTYYTTKNLDGVNDTRYGITANFVARYWRFATDAVVVLNACSSARDGARWSGAFVLACHQAGAGLVMGWTETTTPAGAFTAPRYFVDRMLGANAYEPETTPQRAFAWDKVMADMQAKGKHIDPEHNAVFVAKPRGGVLQLLTPGIHHVEADEFLDQLVLHGDFGSVQGTVTVNGHLRPIVSWAPDKVVCELPRDGDGSCGPVQVRVGNRRSNARWLTEWRTPVSLVFADPGRVPLKITGQCTVRHRADVGPVRERPAQTPLPVERHANPTAEGLLPLHASGTWTDPGAHCSVSWTGDMDYATNVMDVSDHVLWAMLKIDRVKGEHALGLMLGSVAGADFQETGCGHTAPLAAAFGVIDGFVDFKRTTDFGNVVVPLPAARLQLGADFAVLPGQHLEGPYQVRWGAGSVRFAPRSDDVI
jgi:hypothetical protein